MTSVSVEPNTILFSILWCLFFLVTVRVVLWIWATKMVAKPGFNRLELNHFSLLYGDTTCHKSVWVLSPCHGWIYSQSMKHILFDGRPNSEDVLFCSFSIHWSLFIMLQTSWFGGMQTWIPGVPGVSIPCTKSCWAVWIKLLCVSGPRF